MSRASSKAISSLILGFILLTGGVFAETLSETIDKTLPFAAGKLLEISNTNGEIQVSAWDRDEVQIEAVKKVRTGDEERAAKALQELKVIIEETSQGVRIDTDHPNRSDDGWWGRRDISMSVNYRIQIPRQADLDLGTVNGKVFVDGVKGQISLKSTNGGITVEDSGGQVEARTTNGGIDVELREVTEGEDMTFRTTNGGISLTLPSDARASLSARTTNGGINTDFPITVQGSFSKNSLQGEINGGGGNIELKTTNGGIRISEL